MIESTDLDAAVAEGILSEGQRESLVEFARTRRATLIGADEEQFRFITGFNDIFVTIAIVLVLVAVGMLGRRVGGLTGSGAGVALASWLLAEYFSRVRRMALPSIMLLLSFVGGIELAGTGLMSALVGTAERPNGVLMIPLAVTIGGAVAHWRRFHVPITVAAGAGAAAMLMALVITLVTDRLHLDQAVAKSIILAGVAVAGIAAFALAMRFDTSDRTRTTRRTDIAFWLHLLAAPLIVHPLFVLTGIFGATTGIDTWKAIVVVLAYLILAVVALVIDRRALLVSALGYVVYAIYALFKQTGAADMQVALTCLVIGLFLVMLSAAWREVRARMLAFVPPGIAQLVPPAAVLVHDLH